MTKHTIIALKIESKNNVHDKDTDITIGFVFHSRKYSDGSSNLRIQFSRGRGKQYAKNSGLRIFRKHWISKKNEVSDKHVDYIKINKSLNELKEKIPSLKDKLFHHITNNRILELEKQNNFLKLL